MFSLPNDTNLNNFHRELFAVQSLFQSRHFYAAYDVQRSAIWRMKMKESHCGFYSGRLTGAPHLLDTFYFLFTFCTRWRGELF